MKTHLKAQQYRTSFWRTHLPWLALLAAFLVLFPFEWLNRIWPVYALVFDWVFASALAHEIGHATIFFLAGLLILCSMPQLRRYPLFYTAILVLGMLGEESLQAISLNRWQPPNIVDWRAFGFDTLGFVLAYLLVGVWWHSGRHRKEKEKTIQARESSSRLIRYKPWAYLNFKFR